METIQWKVEGMTCANCALTINKYLEKQGQKNVKVNPIDGDVSFEMVSEAAPKEKLNKGHSEPWISVFKAMQHTMTTYKKPFFSNHLHRFLFAFPLHWF